MVSTIQPSGVSFTDVGRRRTTQMPATTPALPNRSGDTATFGAMGSGPTIKQMDARASMEPVRGLLILIGVLVVIRVAWELAEEVTD